LLLFWRYSLGKGLIIKSPELDIESVFGTKRYRGCATFFPEIEGVSRTKTLKAFRQYNAKKEGQDA
jgi:hypothetical protein